ncbi:hypothetical protein CMV_026795, partial [Castanea mollissima]
GRPRLFTLLCSLHQSGRRDEVTSIAMNICHLSTVAEVSEFECDKLLDDIKATKKDTALRLALSRLASDFGRESMLSLQRFFSSRRAPVISTGLLKGLLFKQQHAARKVSAFSCIVNKFNNIVV